ncbi:unnamed protein product, partial [Acidithrix sp. C25]
VLSFLLALLRFLSIFKSPLAIHVLFQVNSSWERFVDL